VDYKKIREKRKEYKLTQSELASVLGVSTNTIGNWEKGEKIPVSKEQILCKFLNNEIDIKTNSQKTLERLIESSKPNINYLKVLNNNEPTGYYHPNVSAAAGMDKEIINDELNRIPISLPNWEKGIAFINVYGDSMYPKFCSGEIIGIKEVELQYVNYGYAYVVILNDGQVFLKYIRKGKDEEHWILASENPKYESKEYHLSLIKKVFIIKGTISKTIM
jgi:transcriptional regulator with XRE-family HTH domain